MDSFEHRRNYEEDTTDELLVWRQSWDALKHFTATLELDIEILIKGSLEKAEELHKKGLSKRSCAKELLDILKRVQGRAANAKRSNVVKMYITNDQADRGLNCLNLKTQIEVRLLSLYDGCKRDFMLQHTLMRVYAHNGDLAGRASDQMQERIFTKLQPQDGEYEMLAEFLAVLREVQKVTLALQKST